MPRKFNESQEKLIIKMYQSGLTMAAISRSRELNSKTKNRDAIKNVLDRHGITIRPHKNKISKKDSAKIVDLYSSGLSAEKIGRIFKVHQTTILSHLYRNNAPMRTTSEAMRIYSCNHDFFEQIDSE